ncbi:MAG: hypothetical protein WC100_03495 [Sterolibacterium sp.]
MKKQIDEIETVTTTARLAPAVWLALQQIANERGSPTVTPTRAQLVKLSGVNRVATISDCLSVLELAGWIDRKLMPVNNNGKMVRMLRIKLLKPWKLEGFGT